MKEIKWKITKQDGSIIKGIENLPKEIFVAKEDIKSNNRPKLMEIKVDEKEYGVNLDNGTFLVNGKWVQHPLVLPEKVDYYRLIYFKRVRKLIAEVPIKWSDGKGGFTEVGSTRNIHLGFQVTIKGQNYKRVLVILPGNNISWTSE